MITKQPTTMTPARKKIPNFKLKEIVSDIIDTPTTEWQSSRIVSLVDTDSSELKLVYNKCDARLLRMYGMSLYCEACRKYDVKPTDCVGKPIEGERFQKWLNRSHKLTYNSQYREEFLKPMMYKLNQLPL
jgi:hypothetical protein